MDLDVLYVATKISGFTGYGINWSLIISTKLFTIN